MKNHKGAKTKQPGRMKSNPKPDLDRALQLLNVKARRLMIVDATTGKDMREAQNFEIEHVFRTANFSGVAVLESCKVTLRRIEDDNLPAVVATRLCAPRGTADPEDICTWPMNGRAPGKQARPCNRTDCPHCRPLVSEALRG